MMKEELIEKIELFQQLIQDSQKKIRLMEMNDSDRHQLEEEKQNLLKLQKELYEMEKELQLMNEEKDEESIDENTQEKIKMIKTTDSRNQFDILRIEPGTIEGINIPFVVALPEKMPANSKITVVFNNEKGTSLNESAQNIEDELPEVLSGLEINSPMVVPILPSKTEFDETLKKEGIDIEVGDPKQFARECFDSKIPKESTFYRLDEQVKNMLEEIKNNKTLQQNIQNARNKTEDLSFDEKAVGFGHSGAGAAMLRFSLIQPELFDKLVIGGNGDIIPTPFGENGQKLEYPFGIKDYNELFGREDDKEVYDTIRDNNYLPGKTGPTFAPQDLAEKYKNMYGNQFFERFQNALKQYEQADANIGLKIYENDCHSVITPEDLGKILNDEEYFEQNPSKTIEEMLSKRRTKQNDGKNGLYDCLDDKNIRESSIKETTNMVKEEILKNDREKTNEEQK